MIERQTRRWSGIVAVVLVAFGAGLLALQPALVLLAILGVGFAVYPHLLPAPDASGIDLHRSISTADPSPGEPVRVTLTIRNDGDRWIPDLRVIDGVPSLLTVSDGNPRIATALAPGGETTIEYTVRAERGKHRFGPTTIITRNIGGSIERSESIVTPTAIDCQSAPLTMTLSDPTTYRPGPIPTNQFGSGVEFYSTREAHPGESIDRIDWRRFARTGELSVIEFRPERAASVIVCVDTIRPDHATGAFTTASIRQSVLSLTAADRVVSAIGKHDHSVGLLNYGAGDVWIPPSTGQEHVEAIHHALDTDPAFAPAGTATTQTDIPTPPTGDESALTESKDNRVVLHERVGPRDHVILVSPLLSNEILEAVLTVDPSSGERVTVLSPHVPAGSGLGGRLTDLARSDRIRTLREYGARVIDWHPDDELAAATAASMEEQIA